MDNGLERVIIFFLMLGWALMVIDGLARLQ